MGNNYKVAEYREDLRAKVDNINDRMIKVETILEQGMPHITKTVDKIEKHLATLNLRTSKLENWRSYTLGLMAVITFAIPIILRIWR